VKQKKNDESEVKNETKMLKKDSKAVEEVIKEDWTVFLRLELNI
jgi:hypothetical protein